MRSNGLDACIHSAHSWMLWEHFGMLSARRPVFSYIAQHICFLLCIYIMCSEFPLMLNGFSLVAVENSVLWMSRQSHVNTHLGSWMIITICGSCPLVVSHELYLMFHQLPSFKISRPMNLNASVCVWCATFRMDFCVWEKSGKTPVGDDANRIKSEDDLDINIKNMHKYRTQFYSDVFEWIINLHLLLNMFDHQTEARPEWRSQRRVVEPLVGMIFGNTF